MREIQRGFRDSLESYLNVQQNIEVELSISGPSIYDFCCFGLDRQEKLSDDRYMIFYNQLRSPKEEIRCVINRNYATFTINLSALPPSIDKLVFTGSIDGSGVMSNINKHTAKIKQNQQTLITMTLVGRDFRLERAINSIEIYRKNGWRIRAVASGFNGGLKELLHLYGGVEAEENHPSPSGNRPNLSSRPPANQPSATPAQAHSSSPSRPQTPAYRPAPQPQQTQAYRPSQSRSVQPTATAPAQSQAPVYRPTPQLQQTQAYRPSQSRSVQPTATTPAQPIHNQSAAVTSRSLPPPKPGSSTNNRPGGSSPTSASTAVSTPPLPPPQLEVPEEPVDHSVAVAKGQVVQLCSPGTTSACQNLVVSFRWNDIILTNSDVDCAASTIICRNGKFQNNLEDIVYFGNPEHSSGAVKKAYPVNTKVGASDMEQFSVDLSLLPSDCNRLLLAATIYTPDTTSSCSTVLSQATVTVYDAQSKRGLYRYTNGENTADGISLIFAELVHQGNAWLFKGLGQSAPAPDIMTLASRYIN